MGAVRLGASPGRTVHGNAQPRRFSDDFITYFGGIMEVCTLASGSSGNCTLVRCGDTCVLLDAGISARRITAGLRELGTEPPELSAILITHEHTDHISGLATLTKKLRVPIYASGATLRQLCYRIPFLEELVRPLEGGQGTQVGALWCQAFSTPHDAAGSQGYSLTGEGRKMALCTDLGFLAPEVLEGAAGAELLLAEANHDEEWVRSGPYPYYLKQRILGDFGHLSNETGAVLAQKAAEGGARAVVLAHLSQQNNTPARAYETVARHLRGAGVDPERDLTLAVAPRSEPGPLYRLEGDRTVRAFRRRGAGLC